MEFYTVQEVADLLKVNKETILRWARAGKLPAAKIARQWRFERADVLRYVEANFLLQTKHPEWFVVTDEKDLGGLKVQDIALSRDKMSAAILGK